MSASKRGGVEKNGVAFAEANASRFFERSRLHPKPNKYGDVLVLTPVRRGQWASRGKRSVRGGVEKNGVVLRKQYEQVFRAEPSTSSKNNHGDVLVLTL